MSDIAAASELVILLIQAYVIAAKQAHMTEQEAVDLFVKNYSKFMADSAQPVDPVWE